VNKISAPVRGTIPSPFACVIIDSLYLKCFGENLDGIFLQPTDEDVTGRQGILESQPLVIGDYDQIVDVSVSINSASETAVCAILAQSNSTFIKCWGKETNRTYHSVN
jgi:hypothetical protein